MEQATEMVCPRIVADTMSVSRNYGSDRSSGQWQYHSRSDFHSVVAAIGTTIDILNSSALIRQHVEDGKVGFGVNVNMVEIGSNRKKALDLVIATPDATRARRPRTLEQLALGNGLVLGDDVWTRLRELPTLVECEVDQPLIALENKACMTAFNKSAPRLHDELESSQQTVNRCSRDCVVSGLALVNTSEKFYSPVFMDNGRTADPNERKPSFNPQPKSAFTTARRLADLPFRTSRTGIGFDALGVLMVRAVNDGSPWTVVDDPEYGAPQPGDHMHYARLVQRVVAEYGSRFSHF